LNGAVHAELSLGVAFADKLILSTTVVVVVAVQLPSVTVTAYVPAAIPDRFCVVAPLSHEKEGEAKPVKARVTPPLGVPQLVLGAGDGLSVGLVSVSVMSSVAGSHSVAAPSGSFVVTVRVTVPAAMSAADRVYTGLGDVLLLNEPLPDVAQVTVGEPVVVVVRLTVFSLAQILTSVLSMEMLTGLGQAHTLTVNIWLVDAVQPLAAVTVTE